MQSQPVKLILAGTDLALLHDSQLIQSLSLEISRVDPTIEHIRSAMTLSPDMVLFHEVNQLNEPLCMAIGSIQSAMKLRRMPSIVLVGEPQEETQKVVARDLGISDWVPQRDLATQMAQLVRASGAVRADGWQQQILLQRMEVAAGRKAWDDALQAINGLIFIDERNAFFVLLLAQQMKASGASEQAFEWIKRCVLSLPDNAMIRSGMAKMFLQRDLPEYGHRILLDLARRDPLLLPGLCMRPTIAAGSESFPQLIHAYNQCFAAESFKDMCVSWLQAAADIDRRSEVVQTLEAILHSVQDPVTRGVISSVLGVSLPEARNFVSEAVAIIPAEMPVVLLSDSKPQGFEDLEDDAVDDLEQAEEEDHVLNYGSLTGDGVDERAGSDQWDGVGDLPAVKSEGGGDLNPATSAAPMSDSAAAVTSPVEPTFVLEIAVEHDEPIQSQAAPGNASSIDRQPAVAAVPKASGGDENVAALPTPEPKAQPLFRLPREEFRIPKTRGVDFARFLNHGKQHVQLEKQIDSLVSSAPDRSMEGRFLVYHYDAGGGAKLRKHLEDMGCRHVILCDELNAVANKLRTMPIKGLIIWLESGRTEAVDLVVDITASEDLCANMIVLATASNDATRKIVVSSPHIMFDGATSECVSRTKFGRSIEDAYLKSLAQTPSKVLCQINRLLQNGVENVSEASQLIKKLAEMPGKGVWALIQSARVQLLQQSFASATRTLQEAAQKFPDLWLITELQADCIAAKNGVEEAADYLLKTITTHRTLSDEKLVRAARKLLEWSNPDGLAYLLNFWRDSKRATTDGEFHYFVARYLMMVEGEQSKTELMSHLYAAAMALPGHREILRTIAEQLEADRFHYRAEDVWNLARAAHRSDSLICDLGLTRCYYEGRKMRKGDDLVENILERYPGHPEATAILQRYRRHVA
jgi:predicted Zn-dependent protease